MRVHRWAVGLLAFGAVAIPILVATSPAAAAAATFTGPSQVTLSATQSSVYVLLVNTSAKPLTLTPTPDTRLSKLATVKCDCAGVASGATTQVELDRVAGAPGGSGVLALVDAADPTSVLLVSVTVESPRGAAGSNAAPASLPMKIRASTFCEVENVIPPPGFSNLRGSLTGPSSIAAYGIIAWSGSVDTTTCSLAQQALGQPGAALPTVTGPPTALLVFARGLKDAGTWTATANLDPSASDKGALTITVKRTFGAWSAFWLVLASAALASLLGFLATVLGPKLKDNQTRASLRAYADTSDAALQAFLDANLAALGVAPAAVHDIKEAWATSADGLRTGPDDITELTRRKTMLASATAALKHLVAALGVLGDDRAQTNLFAAVVTAAKLGPDLTSTAAAPIIAAAGDAAVWVTLVDDLDWSIGRSDTPTPLEALRTTALNTVTVSPAADALHLFAQLSELQQHAQLRTAYTPPRAFSAPSAQLRLTGVAGGDLGDALFTSVPAVGPAVVVVPAKPDYVAQAREARRLSLLVEILIAVLALALGVVLALSAQYYASDIWGTTGDKLKAFTWAFGASGTVQVAKALFTGSSPIKVGSS